VGAGSNHNQEAAMSNTDSLKQGYEAFGSGDLEGATANFADDIRWENPEASQIPNNGVTEGKDNVKQLFAELGNYWASFTITPDEFIESGETVVVLSHSEAEAKDTGTEVKLPWVHVWRFRDGKITEVQALTDTALAAEALGTL
jgi:ketosteroid isomerase-like protein